MPSVVTVRAKQDRRLICFGPVNVGYEPGFNPTIMDRAIEPDYDTVAAEWAAQLAQPAEIDASIAGRFDNMDKTEKAALLVVRAYCNAILAGTYTNKTIPQLKQDFIAAYKAIP